MSSTSTKTTAAIGAAFAVALALTACAPGGSSSGAAT